MPDGKGIEAVAGYLSLSAEELASPWGPGSHSWHMDLQYDVRLSQWKAPDQSQGLLPNKTGDEPTCELSDAADQPHIQRVSDWSALPAFSLAQLETCATPFNGGDHVSKTQHVNLFWDLWRLRTISVQNPRTATV